MAGANRQTNSKRSLPTGGNSRLSSSPSTDAFTTRRVTGSSESVCEPENRRRGDERRKDNRTQAQAGARRDQSSHARRRADGFRRVSRYGRTCELRGQAQRLLRAREAAGESLRALSNAGPDRGRSQGGDRHRRRAARGAQHIFRLRQPGLEALELQRSRGAGAGRFSHHGRAGEGRDADLPQGRPERSAERAHAERRLLLRCDHPPEADRPRPSEPRGQHRAVSAADRGPARRDRRGCARASTPASTPCSLRW